MNDIKPASFTWDRIKPWLGLTALFVAGLLLGSVLTVKIIKHKLQQLAQASPATLSEMAVARLDKKLDLKAEQKSRIAGIIRSRQEKIRAIRMKVLPEIGEILQGGRREIEAELDPSQKEKFGSWADQQRERLQKFLAP